MRAKKSALILMIVLLATTLPSLAKCEETESTEPHDWALQFSIQENLTLGAFYYGGISFKDIRSEYSALRYGVSLHYSYNSAPSHRFSTEFTIVYQRYINPSSRAKFYWGVGPTISLYYRYVYREEEGLYAASTDKSVRGGIVGLGGIEWFATSSISFHAEYQLNAVVGWRQRTDENNWDDGELTERKSDELNIDIGNLSSVRFGISVYF